MVLNINTYRIFIFFTIILFCGKNNFAYSQNICSSPPANSEVGAFEIDNGIDIGCSPFNVRLNDLSGGTDIRYDFFYTGKPASQLDKTGNTATSNPYFANTNTNTYIILQYGKKNGKEMYACKSITVKPNTKPKFTYSQCQSLVEVAISESKENNYDYFEIEWENNPSTKIKVEKNQLPFAFTKQVNYPAQIKVEGFPNNGIGCTNINIQTVVAANLTNYPNGIAPPYDPNLDTLTMISKSEILLKFKGSENSSGYNLYIRENNGAYNYSILKSGIKPGANKIILPDSNKSYCFFTNRDFCYEYSSEVCTVPLEKILINDVKLNLNWGNYPKLMHNKLQSVGRNILEKTIYIQKKTNNSLYEFKVNEKDIKYEEEIKDCLENSQYRIKILITGLLERYRYSSVIYSNWESIKYEDIIPPAINEVYATITDNKYISVIIKDDSSWKIPKTKYYLYDSLGINLDSIFSNKNIFKYPIPNDVKNLNFKVGFKDKCGSKSQLTNSIYPIFLNQNAKLNLQWTSKNPFNNENILEYNLILLDEISKNKKADWKYINSINEATPNFMDTESTAYYVIEAIGNINKKSYSNIIEIPIKPVLYIPNSFSPNGDNINDLFEIKGNLNGVNTYDFQIFSRWGDVDYQSTDYKKQWDGNISGKSAPLGTYYFKLKALFKNSEKIIKNGSFELFR